MSQTTTPIAQPALARLDWESDHFGIHAAQLTAAELNDAALAAALRLARAQGVQWLVWPVPAQRDVPSELLDEFTGALVDRKATFSTSLTSDFPVDEPPQHASCIVKRYAGPTVSADLYELAISAGAYSRFKVDPHLPEERFEAMYRRWIERSVGGELADVVLVACDTQRATSADPTLAGMVTLAESGGTGSIGLVAVAAAFRGRRIATTLMHAAHQWFRQRRASHAQVVTQRANVPACRLYARCGYRQSDVRNYYHFWPQLATRNR